MFNVAIFAQTNETENKGGNVRYFNLDSLNAKLFIFKALEVKLKKEEEKASIKMEKRQGQINLWQE